MILIIKFTQLFRPSYYNCLLLFVTMDTKSTDSIILYVFFVSMVTTISCQLVSSSGVSEHAHSLY